METTTYLPGNTLESKPDSTSTPNLPQGPGVFFVDSLPAVVAMVDALSELPATPPPLYVDLEGINLSRYGTISIIQIYVLPAGKTFLIDVYTLGEYAFCTLGRTGWDLRGILQEERIPKVFFDVRNDSDALSSRFGVRLQGVQDLQLMELATRSYNRRHLCGLSKCIARDGGLTPAEKTVWLETKERGLALFAPERGGSYAVFNQRPLSGEIQAYCVQDVQYLPRLWALYKLRLTPFWDLQVQEESRQRVAESQAPGYLPNGPQKALAPKGWESLKDNGQ